MNEPVQDDLSFHHIGWATRSIERERKQLAPLGYQMEGEAFEDPTQGVRGCFVSGPGPRIELLENLPESSTLTPWLDASIKMYHMAYFADDFDAAIARQKSHRAKTIVAPVPAVAFGGRRITFLMLPNSFLIELIER